MKKIYKYIIGFLIGILGLFSFINLAFSAGCPGGGSGGWINGSWTVTTNCTFPTGPHLINGNVSVGNYTVTVPNNSMLVMDLNNRKITFNSGKILLQGNAVIKYVWNDGYTSSSGIKRCPSGQKAYLPTSLGDAPSSLSSNNASSSGRFYCH